MHYGELPDELAVELEQHLGGCEDCRRELNAMRAMDEEFAVLPVLEPSPNLVVQARMRLDEELDLIPPHGLVTRLRSELLPLGGTSAECSGTGDVAGGVGISGGELYVPVRGGAGA